MRIPFAVITRNCWMSGLALGLVGCSTMKAPSMPKMADRTPMSSEQRSVMVPGTDIGEEAREPKHPERVHMAYGRWLEQQKQLPEAKESYQKALDLDPKSIDALLGLSRLEQLAGRNAEAEKHLQKAQKLRPKEPLVHAAWAEYYASKQQWGPAVKKYRDAIELAPDEPLFKHQLAVLLGKSGDWDGAYQTFSTIVTPGEAHYNVGYLMHQQGQLVEAEKHLQQAVEIKPDLALAVGLLAKIQKERNGKSAIATRAPVETPAPATPAPAKEAVIQPAGAWEVHETTPTPTRSVSSNPVSNPTPQQLEQWQNQQSAIAPR